MSGFVIWVVFRLRPGTRDRFLELVSENATASVRNEPGCSRFDVTVPHQGDANVVALYEIYDSADAFQAHLQTAHFKAFDAETAAMVEDKRVEQYDLTHVG